MNPNTAKSKLDNLSAMARGIDRANRRKVVAEEIRPALEDLRSDWDKFDMDPRRFSNQVDTLKGWATQIWMKADGHITAGKFEAELFKLETHLKKT
jgi:hypothetical protein